MDNQPKRRKLISRLEETQDELSQSVIRNSIKSCGRIKKIVLKNVLCHSHLVCEFNESLGTLIQGSNGSGKSSIVSAIIAGFGGSAQMADKGKTFKNLIQNDKNQATIEIYLNNDGVNSFKKEDYGNTIICERKIPLTGSGSYRLLNERGKVISTKKDDMQRMLQRFNIQVDNPVIILSQERAKSFLAATTPQSFFKFYMLSTGLQQILDDYAEIQKNLQHSEMMLNWKVENLNDLVKDLKTWERKCKNIKALDGKKEKVARLKKEFVMAQVWELTEQLSNLESARNKKQSKLDKIKEKLKNIDGSKKDIEENKKKIEADSEEVILRLNNVRKNRNTVEQEINAKKRELRELNNEIRNIDGEMKRKQSDIQSLQQSLASDNNSAHQRWAELMNNINIQKESIKVNLAELSSRREVANTHSINLNEENVTQMKEDYTNVNHELIGLKNRQKHLAHELNSFKANQNNSLSVFGYLMPTIVAEIDKNARMFRHKPIGPIGAHVNCKDKLWTHVAELVLKPILTTFLVCCQEDFKSLRQIFHRMFQNPAQQYKIIVTKFRDRMHDVRKFETHYNNERKRITYNSLWSILEINNMHVANTILDQLSVETILLIPTSAEAGSLLKDSNNVPPNCKKAYTLYQDLYFPDPNFRVYSGDGRGKANFLQCSTQDKINDLKISLEKTTEEIRKSEAELKEKANELSKIENEYKQNIQQKKQLETQILRKKKEYHDLVDKEEPPPQDVEQLQNDLKVNEEAFEALATKQSEIREKIESVKHSSLQLTEQKNTVIAEESTYTDEVAKMQEKLNENDGKRKNFAYEVAIYKEKKKFLEQQLQSSCDAEINQLRNLLEEKQKNLPEPLDNNNHEGPRTRRNAEDVKREIGALQSAIKEEEAKTGDLETIINKVQEKTQNYSHRKEQITEQETLIKKLKASIEDRHQLLKTMKNFTAMYLNSSFSTAIEQRNMQGKIVVEYEKCQLKIMVQKTKERTKVPVMQSLQMMSGGEKSFATVSFILALWDIIKSPIRILDEFDVFMDNISRNQVVQMMTQSIKPNIQYIFISPLEYSDAKFSVVRLKDPRK